MRFLVIKDTVCWWKMSFSIFCSNFFIGGVYSSFLWERRMTLLGRRVFQNASSVDLLRKKGHNNGVRNFFLFFWGGRRWKYYIQGNARYLNKRLVTSVKIFVTSIEIFDTSGYLSIYHLRNILLSKFVIKDYGRGGENVLN